MVQCRSKVEFIGGADIKNINEVEKLSPTMVGRRKKFGDFKSLKQP